MVSEVRASPEKVAAALAILHNNKLVSVAPGDPKSFRYSPATAALRTSVDNLQVAYNTRPVTAERTVLAWLRTGITVWRGASHMAGSIPARRIR